MAINGTNNVSITLQFTLTSGATTIILPTGKWGLFTWATTPLRWVIEEFDDSKNVVKREIVSITWISGDQLTIARAVEPCPIGDSASAQQQVSQVFNTPAKTKISVAMTKGMIDDINSSVSALTTNKLNANGWYRTGLGAKKVLVTDASGNEVEVSWTTGQVLGFGASNVPQAMSPSVDIHGTTQKTTPIGADELVVSDSEELFVNKRITIQSIKKSTQAKLTAGEDISSWQAVGINMVRDKYTFDGTTIDSAKWTTNGTVTQNWYIEVTSNTNIWAFVNQIKSVSTYTEPIEIIADLYVQINSINNPPNIADLVLYFNATNHIKFQLNISSWWGASYVQITSTKNGSVEYSAQSSNQWASNGFSSLARTIKVTYEPTTGYVNLYYLSWWSWVQVWAQFTTTFGSSTPYNFVFTQENTATSASQLLSRLDNFNISYISQTKQLYLCNASDKYSLNFNGFAAGTYTKWSQASIDTSGVNSQQTWLVIWETYYLSNTSWGISMTPGTYVERVWKALSATEIQIDVTEGTKPEESRTVTISPCILRNWNQAAMMRIIGWTVSLIQYSRDGINYTTVAAATNTQVVLWGLDYVKITYSVIPSVTLTNL